MVNTHIRMVKKHSVNASLSVMTCYRFHPTLLVRTPVYPYHTYPELNWADIMLQPLFKKAIWFASEAFYRELDKAGFDFEKLDKKAKNTVKKYVNRMHYRPTPFGLCSAFGVLSWGTCNTFSFDADKLRPHLQFSYARNAELGKTTLALHEKELEYRLNDTVYRTGKEYRFIRSDGNNAQIEFRIDSLPTDAFFDKLTVFLKKPRPKVEITAWICTQADCPTIEAEKYIEWLIQQQLIHHQLETNITGPDWIDRVLQQTGQTLSLVDEMKRATTINDLKVDDKLSSADVYLNTEIKLDDATLDTSLQQAISDGVACLQQLSSKQDNPAIKRFKSDLIQKFEMQAVPLLMALDPEVGVGYGSLEMENDDSNLLKGLNSINTDEQNVTVSWGNIHKILLEKWHNDGGIVFTPDDLKNLDNNEATTAQSISVMFRMAGKQVYIEQAGGVSASALIGRFTPFNTVIHHLAIDMAEEESKANAEVIFAEIAHICNERTANIDRRKHIYAYEIPVLTQSELPLEQQIPLNDLWVAVRNGSVILWSQRHGKRVIPRLSSAFNYTRNDLAVFRFLCDMQHADIKTNMSFNLNRFFPGLTYYPRVSYKNTILQLAYWNIQQTVFLPAIKATADEQTFLFNQVKASHNLPRFVALTQHDHQLVFDLEKPSEVAFLLDTIKDASQITLKEFLLPDEKQSHITQFIASLYHTNNLYEPAAKSDFADLKVSTNKLLPGSEWLYLKLYCHPIRSNQLLQGPLHGLIRQCARRQLVTEWFFIRYLDPDYHIRLRLKVAPGRHQQVLDKAFKVIAPLVNEGIISRYSIDTYERETERYGTGAIHNVESIFYASSALIVKFLRHHDSPTEEDILAFATASVKDILTAAGLQGEALVAFLDNVLAAFLIEFSNIPDLKPRLDTIYRKQKSVIEHTRQNMDIYFNDMDLKKQRVQLLNNVMMLEKNEKRLAALIHMHLNRLFVSDARKQEMGIYYFLLKYERSVLARQKFNSN